jgi:hypothetical protein
MAHFAVRQFRALRRTFGPDQSLYPCLQLGDEKHSFRDFPETSWAAPVPVPGDERKGLQVQWAAKTRERREPAFAF